MYRDPRFSGIFQTLGGPAAKPPTLLQKVVARSSWRASSCSR